LSALLLVIPLAEAEWLGPSSGLSEGGDANDFTSALAVPCRDAGDPTVTLVSRIGRLFEAAFWAKAVAGRSWSAVHRIPPGVRERPVRGCW
jgi:hypothetical protein